MTNHAANEETILVFAPTGRDAEMTHDVLESAGMRSQVCRHIHDVCEELRRGAAAILIADETLNDPALQYLLRTLDEQPPWSDIPVIVFPTNAGNAALLLERLGSRANVTILERPVRIAFLLNAVKSALRARRRQYEARDLLLQLENADRQKDLFLAMLSHELRTPLNAILGWCRILEREAVDEETKGRALDVIKRNATAQAQLIADILSVSQIVAGKLSIETQPVRLDGIIRSSIESLRPSAEARGISIAYRFDHPGVTVLGDAGRLQQVVSNLLSNSVKFTPVGGNVEVELTSSATKVEIIVRDNGKGIAPEFLPYVFDRFRQGDSSYTRSEGGLGLGLAIARHLIEMHQGNLRAESMGPNLGAVFTITLPIHAAAEDTSITSADDVGPVLDGLHIVAVDDDKDSLFLLTAVLERYGAEVKAVTSATDALAAIAEDEPDIVVSDIGMPHKDGYELIRNISASGRRIPAIALTGYASHQDRERAFAAGYRLHLAKPFDPLDLVRSIETILNRKPGLTSSERA